MRFDAHQILSHTHTQPKF